MSLKRWMIAGAAALALAGAATASFGDQWSDLYATVYNSDENLTAQVIQAGADVNVRSPQGWTVLMVAAQKNDADMVRLLLERGADVNARNPDGAAPVELATDPAVQALLTAAGATPAAAAGVGSASATTGAAAPAETGAPAEAMAATPAQGAAPAQTAAAEPAAAPDVAEEIGLSPEEAERERAQCRSTASRARRRCGPYEFDCKSRVNRNLETCLQGVNG